MATGAPGTNGVWQYGEDDSEATFSALLNKVASTANTSIGTDRGRLSALEAVPQPGLVRIIPASTAYTGGSAPTVSTNGEVTFGSSTVISLNNVFSSAYENYKIIFVNKGGTANTTDIFMRLRVSGTDNTANSYQQTGRLLNLGGGATDRVRASQPAWYTSAQGNATGVQGFTWFDIAAPFLATKSYMNGQTSYANGATFVNEYYGGSHDVTTSYTGITLYSASGFSGTIQVFGYRK